MATLLICSEPGAGRVRENAYKKIRLFSKNGKKLGPLMIGDRRLVITSSLIVY